MKIVLFNKRKLLISCCIIFIIVFISLVYLILQSSETFAVELSNNSVASNEFENKISELTKGEEKIAYLTFDDGPTTSVTPKILDILKSEDVKATFL